MTLLTTILTLTASAIFLVAFALYNRDIFAGKIRPSIVTWGLFCAITTIAASSYRVMTGDWLKTVVVTTDCSICYVTTGFLIYRRSRIQKPDAVDWMIALSCIASLAAWTFLQSPVAGNMVIQVAATLGFLPTIRKVIRDPQSEAAAPWLLWTAAYALQGSVVLMRWQGHSVDLVAPAQAILLHVTVGILALRRISPVAAVGA